MKKRTCGFPAQSTCKQVRVDGMVHSSVTHGSLLPGNNGPHDSLEATSQAKGHEGGAGCKP
eukprot:1158743-Pelagomonas_calceolata.AAC.33